MISAVSAFDLGQTTAKIRWTLNEVATGQVEYGPTTSYGRLSVKENSLQYTTHVQQLSGLTPSTTYHFRVASVHGGRCQGAQRVRFGFHENTEEHAGAS